MLRRSLFTLLCTFACIPLLSTASPAQTLTPVERDTLFQVSTISRLLAGYYDGEVKISTMLEHGSFGMGTFQDLDGEMLVLNGVCWKIPADGKPVKVTSGKTPFMQVTEFETDMEITLTYVKDYDDFKRRLAKELPGLGVFYAIRVTGTFQHLKTRSVPKQNKPYPGLLEVIKKQSVFDLSGDTGTMVGFHSPEFVQGVGAPGLHLHFLNDRESAGGHVLDFSAQTVTVDIDLTPMFEMRLPKNSFF